MKPIRAMYFVAGCLDLNSESYVRTQDQYKIITIVDHVEWNKQGAHLHGLSAGNSVA